MTFVLTIRVPIDEHGWKGMDHLPTLQIDAPTRKDAEARVSIILAHMPPDTVGELVPV
jgi:hypothetical protein